MSHRIRLDAAKCKDATAEQRRRLHGVVKWLRWAATVLRVHPDTEIAVRYKKPEKHPEEGSGRGRWRYDNDGKWLMYLHLDSADYGRYRIDVSARCLDPKRDHLRPLDSIHEMTHVRCYAYTSLAESLSDDSTALQKREESLVTHLEHAIALLAGLPLGPEP